ncbi:hypothetical protein ACVNS2_09770 [Paenibacillus caseinilyticus]|uniref:Uncharacterized protein n=1 Tax=Paenibacillus mucilaginosus K02 TaxID=997761 RepID=I0BEY6_9BACL|nr:hypothetical protein [Paenibacillus mucilaginosus]AFH60933.1 hypothetical protein B2K_09395 [Paenibacillus mucilaginosus K02]
MEGPLVFTIVYLIIWSIVLSLGLALFRMRVSAYTAPLMISVIPMTLLSVILQLLNSAYLTSIIQPVGAVLCYGLIFRFRWWHSILMVILYYPINIFLEVFYNFLMTRYQWDRVVYHMVEEDLFSVGGLLIFTNLLILWILQHFRLGFTFIPANPSLVRFRSMSDQMLAFLLAAFCITGIAGFAIFFLHTAVMILIVIVLVILWLLIVRLAYREESRD